MRMWRGAAEGDGGGIVLDPAHSNVNLTILTTKSKVFQAEIKVCLPTTQVPNYIHLLVISRHLVVTRELIADPLHCTSVRLNLAFYLSPYLYSLSYKLRHITCTHILCLGFRAS